ncbi:MAG: glycosyltransferase family 4 protein [Acidobacteria bacterium]|nr:glycosyltransferase family 4 protein [Acidobacteriota bacterium]
MKINWFSPLPPLKTEIANATARILPALSQHADVTLWTDQDAWSAELEKFADVRRYSLETLGGDELVDGINVFNPGNNVQFHYSIFQAMERFSGLVIMHDPVLFDACAARCLRAERNVEGFLTQLEFYYGHRGRKDGERFFLNAIKGRAYDVLDSMLANYPMTALGLEFAQGVLVHSAKVAEEMEEYGCFPVEFAELAYDAVSAEPPAPVEKDGPIRLILFGFISPNRCLDEAFEAVARLRSKVSLRLDIFGELWDEEYVDRAIARLGIGDSVAFHGYVAEDELNSAIRRADLAINLRRPTRGESSGTQLRLWENGCPGIVTRDGWYAGIDPRAVIFAEPGSEIEQICRAVEQLTEDRCCFREIAVRGHEVLREKHTPAAYVRSLLHLAEQRQEGEVDHRLALREHTCQETVSTERINQLLDLKDQMRRGRELRNTKLDTILRFRQFGGRILKAPVIAPLFGDRLRAALRGNRN